MGSGAPALASRHAPAVAVFAALLAVYSLTACRTVLPGDSTEFAAALCSWGIPHAPGYPLLSLLGNVLTHAVPIGTPAHMLNLMNAAFAALACALVAEATLAVTGSGLAGLVAGLALGSSRVFWQQALGIEVFSLNAAVAAALLLVLARMAVARDAGTTSRAIPVVLLLLTTALTHHQTILLLGVPGALMTAIFAYRAARARSREGAFAFPWWRCAIVLGLGLLPVLYIPVAAHFEPRVSWGDVRDAGSFLRLLLRRDFGTSLLVGPSYPVSQVLALGEQASPLAWRNYQLFWADLPRSFGWAFLPLPLLGLFAARRRAPALTWLAAGFLVMLTLFFARANSPITPLGTWLTRRFFVLPHVVFAFYAGLGVAFLLERAAPRAWLRRGLAIALPAVTALAMCVANWTAVDAHANTFTRDFGRNLLLGVPPRAQFYTAGDLFYFSLLYQQCGERRRADVTLVEQGLLVHPWYVPQLVRRGELRAGDAPPPVTPGAPWLNSLGLLDANAHAGSPAAGGRPAVVVKFDDGSYEARYRLVPYGIWSQAVRREAVVDPYAAADRYAAIVRQWDLSSLEPVYPADSWEATERRFYGFALGQLQGMRDVGLFATGGPAAARPFAFESRAARWPASQRAELFAYRADFIRSYLADSLTAPRADSQLVLARLAADLAAVSLRLDPANLQALQTTAALLGTRPELRDDRLEYDVRRRIVAARPGELGELVPYFRLALRLGHDTAAGDSIRADAERVRARFVALLEICEQLSDAPVLEVLHRRWDAPLGEVPGLAEATSGGAAPPPRGAR